MNLNIDKAIPRKLSIALATLYLLKDIEPTETVKMICMAAVAGIAMFMQWNLDRGTRPPKHD